MQPEKGFRILMLEDSASDAELIERELRRIEFSWIIKRVETEPDFRQALKEFDPEMILSDYNLPGFNGLSALAIARSESPNVPFIFVSGAIGEDRAIEALHTGATDYVLKDRLSRLLPALRRALKELDQRLARRKAEEELRASETRFRAFMDHNPAVAFLKTEDGRYLYVNRRFEQRFNLVKTDWLGKTDFDLWPEEMAQRLTDNDQRVLSSNRAAELLEIVPTPDGIMRPWLVFRFPVLDMNRKLLGGMAVDLTEQKRLEESMMRMAAIIEATSDFVSITDPDGKFLYLNSAGRRMLGIEEKEDISNMFIDGCYPPLLIEKIVHEAVPLAIRHGIWSGETTFLSLQGKEIPVSQVILSRKSDEGQVEFIGTIARDISERKRVESRLKQAIGELSQLNAELDKKNAELKQLDQLKTDFVSTVSHELRTPMTIMRESIAQVMDKLHGDITAGQEKRLSTTLSNIDRLRHIVDNLLDVAKLEANKLKLRREKINLATLINDVALSFEPQIKAKGLNIHCRFSHPVIETDADPDRLIQVFMNLINNAVKFTDEGYVEIAVAEKERDIECRVIDTGRGIQPEDQAKVFNKFEQFGRQEGPGERGTGLGLSICKEIIKLHHGDLWVESQIGHGTTFIFTLPKFSIKELFLEELSRQLKGVTSEADKLSVIILEITNLHALEQELGEERMKGLEKEFIRLIKRCLRPEIDVVIYNDRFVLMVLPDVAKDEALIACGRIRQSIEDLLGREQLQSRIEMLIKAAEYPGDGKNEQELLDKLVLI